MALSPDVAATSPTHSAKKRLREHETDVHLDNDDEDDLDDDAEEDSIIDMLTQHAQPQQLKFTSDTPPANKPHKRERRSPIWNYCLPAPTQPDGLPRNKKGKASWICALCSENPCEYQISGGTTLPRKHLREVHGVSEDLWPVKKIKTQDEGQSSLIEDGPAAGTRLRSRGSLNKRVSADKSGQKPEQENRDFLKDTVNRDDDDDAAERQIQLAAKAQQTSIDSEQFHTPKSVTSPNNFEPSSAASNSHGNPSTNTTPTTASPSEPPQPTPRELSLQNEFDQLWNLHCVLRQEKLLTDDRYIQSSAAQARAEAKLEVVNRGADDLRRRTAELQALLIELKGELGESKAKEVVLKSEITLLQANSTR
ncbi:MAG: hypothetical protein M1834_004728 [Cirrosporium novae-zelandiae]|nr:MAG: hypothetical protein M1834_004728 [Cirrosporium novae-zelandiae]